MLKVIQLPTVYYVAKQCDSADRDLRSGNPIMADTAHAGVFLATATSSLRLEDKGIGDTAKKKKKKDSREKIKRNKVKIKKLNYKTGKLLFCFHRIIVST